MMTTPLPIDQMIDLKRGAISREIFVSPDFYREELEKLFTRAWLFVGHESLIPNPGDFFVSRMGEESVILCRDAQGAVHVFLNSCRHRGMKVCRYEQGNTSLFVCPYHSWSYTTDGKLQGVPLYRALYEGTLNREEWSLIEVPKLALYKGTVWASWDPQAPDFLDYLGTAVEHLDQVLDCRDGRPGGSEVIGVHKWVFPSNWKFAAENFLGDTYHNPSHRSVDMIGIGPSAQRGEKGRRDNEYNKGQHVWVGHPGGHGMHSVLMPPTMQYEPSYAQYPAVDDYFRHCFEERKRRLGRQGQAAAIHRQSVSQHVLSWPPATRHLCMASTQPDRDRGLALLPGRRRRAGRGERRAAALLHALLGPRGNDRAGRHGELAVCHLSQQGHHRAAASVQLSDVDGGVQDRRPDPWRRVTADHRADAT